MQCKDIPAEPILRFLAGDLGRYDDGSPRSWATWFDNEDGPPPPNSVVRAMPDGTPEKLVLAKMKRLIDRGLVDGCACGCRGDFEITERGARLVAGAENGKGAIG